MALSPSPHLGKEHFARLLLPFPPQHSHHTALGMTLGQLVYCLGLPPSERNPANGGPHCPALSSCPCVSQSCQVGRLHKPPDSTTTDCSFSAFISGTVIGRHWSTSLTQPVHRYVTLFCVSLEERALRSHCFNIWKKEKQGRG